MTEPGRATPSATGLNVRARLARLGSARSSIPALDALLQSVRATHPRADAALIERAYRTAEQAHDGQMRKSGDPYITHPLAVAGILAELGMTDSTIAAALLHDTVEDTDYSLEELRRDFGDEIAMLVDGVTKLDRMTYGEAAQAETVRKMVVAMAKDIRVLVIKLGDRLHNARTWEHMPAQKAAKKARETLEIYAPLAHRLGMNTVKWELEDLSFATLHPKIYDEIVRQVADEAPAREEYLGRVRDQLEGDLRAARINAVVTGRPKHYYSVYQKMVVKGRDFEDIHDLVALRVLVDSVRDCYAVLGTIHTRWNPLPGRFKDYIAMPKFNMYQSLHTTVMGPEGRPVEIQIRTHDMHRRAEYGVAAHWKYKDRNGGEAVGGAPGAGGSLEDMAWLRQLVDWQHETSDPEEFLDSLRFEINAREVYVFTPKGEVVSLPAGSTPVDFAYAVHTEVGHHCVGARVGGRLVPLDRALDNGDVVEVLTSRADGAGPSRDWLGFVQSARARNKIRQWFSRERREESIEMGRDQLVRLLRKQSLPVAQWMTPEALAPVVDQLHYADADGLFAAVGASHVSAEHVVSQMSAHHLGEVGDASAAGAPPAVESQTRRQSKRGDAGVTVVGTDDVWVKLARCCTPVPGDAIIGFVTTGRGVSVHRHDCPNATTLNAHPERLIPVEWAQGKDSVFLVHVQVEALDRSGLVSDVTRVINDQRVNIMSVQMSTGRNRMATGRFTFEMADPGHLEHVLSALRRVPGVYDVFRTTG